MTGPRVVVVGDIADDIVVVPAGPIEPDTDTTSRIERRPGGAAANTACWLGALGVPVTFVGTVHRDDVDRHAALLRASGVDPLLTASDEPTGAVVSLVGGERRALLTSRGANAATAPGQVTDDLLAGAAHLHVPGYSLFGPGGALPWRDLFARAARLGLSRSVDPSSASYLVAAGAPAFATAIEGVEVLLPGAEEAAALTGADDPEAALMILLRRHETVVVKRGALGSIGASRADASVGRILTRAASAARVLDPTGAGDAFDAGFLAARLAGADLADCLQRGAEIAALAVAVVGARPG